jgi:hypothetical protein
MHPILIFCDDVDGAEIAFSQDLTSPLSSVMSPAHLGVKKISQNLDSDIKIKQFMSSV